MPKIQKIIKLYDKLYKLQKNGDDTEGIIILKFWKTELEKEFDELSNQTIIKHNDNILLKIIEMDGKI